MKRIAVVPGDGIGIDVVREAVKVLEAVGGHLGGEKLTLEHFDWGAETYLETGISMPPDGLDRMRTFDAILLGALGLKLRYILIQMSIRVALQEILKF